MNYLRIEAEGQFLRLLPASERDRVFGEWYRGRVARTLGGIHARRRRGPETAIPFADRAHAKEELVTLLLTKELPAAVVGPRDPNPMARRGARGGAAPRALRVCDARRRREARAHVAPFPDTALLRVKAVSQDDLVYTIARNRSHTSVEYIFAEGVELEPSEDTLQLVNGIATSRAELAARRRRAGSRPVRHSMASAQAG